MKTQTGAHRMSISHSLRAALSPHRLACELIEDSQDEEPGRATNLDIDESKDSAWLARHLEECARCRAHRVELAGYQAELRQAVFATAPENFVADVMRRTQTQARPVSLPKAARADRPNVSPLHTFMRSGKGLRLGVAFTAAALTIVFATVLVHRTDPDSPSAPTAGGVTLGGADLAPASPGQRTDLVVRALGIGAAVARRQVMAVLEEAEGVIAPESASLGEGVIMARVSREKLMFVMRTLARKGPYKVVKSDDRKLDGDDISIRFELE